MDVAGIGGANNHVNRSVILAFGLVMCATSLAADPVKDAIVAIRIGSSYCPLNKTPTGQWQATLHGGIWNVRFAALESKPDCPLYSVTVRASDGKVTPCVLCLPKNDENSN